MLLSGAVLVFVTVALPPAAMGSDALIAVMGVVLTLAGIGLLWRGEAPEPVLGVAAALGTAVITLSTYEAGLSGQGADDNEILYLWVCLYSFYFLSLRHALLQLALVAGAYGWLLVDQADPETIATRLVVTTATLLIAGLLIARLRGGLERMLDELARHARYDALTGALNRRGLEERAAVEVARAGRDGSALTVIAVDVDAFKAFNDSHGHPSGDEVLRTVAHVLAEHTRAGIDAVARVGGDEFALLLPGTELEEARAIAERLRMTASRRLSDRGYESRISLGVATSGPAVSPSFDQLYAAADEALYEAKRRGGNQVRVARAPARRPALAAPAAV